MQSSIYSESYMDNHKTLFKLQYYLAIINQSTFFFPFTRLDTHSLQHDKTHIFMYMFSIYFHKEKPIILDAW